MALALGYLDHKEELQNKPILRRKLEELNKTLSLEYSFRIFGGKPQPIELKVQRKAGGEQKCWLNSKPVDQDTIAQDFDVIFLTEDDPRQVVTNSLNKLADYFRALDERLEDLQKSLRTGIFEIENFRNFKTNEKALLAEIAEYKNAMSKGKAECSSLQEKLEKVKRKREIEENLDLLKNEGNIASDFERLKKRYEQLKGKEEHDLAQQIRKQRVKLLNANNEFEQLSMRVVQICQSLRNYGVLLNSDKLLGNDHSELNAIIVKTLAQDQNKNIKIAIVDNMIDLFRVYREDDIVPVINKPVKEVLKELYRLKALDNSDRVSSLLTTLKQVLIQRSEKTHLSDRINERITELLESGKDLENIEKIEKEFYEAQSRYFALQKAVQQDKTKQAYEWSTLRLVEGDLQSIENRMHELDVQIRTGESMKRRCEEKLEILRENASNKPKYEEKEKKLRCLMETIIHTMENIHNWIEILKNPVGTGKAFEKLGERPGFGLLDYRKFVRVVGESLGKQFEPVWFDSKFHRITFFDIEKNIFITDEDREIKIDNLSTGQSKITALSGIFKKMDPDKKKIILVDEIAVVDPEKVENLKKTLKEKFDEGLILLAVLLRPSAQVIEIKSWG